MSEEAENVIDTDEDKSSGEESQSSSISSQQIQHSWVFVEKDQVDEVDMPKDSSGDDKCNCLPDSPCANDCPENYEETQHPEVPSLSVPIQTGLLRVDATGTLESCAVIEHRESDSDIEVVERANNIESLSLSSLDEILPRTYQRLLIDILNSRQRHSSEEREGERGTPESSSHQESDELEALEDDIDPGSTDLPANLSVIQPEKKYVHHRNAKLNLLLNVVVAITIALVLGLGVGHFLGWSSQWSHYTQIQTAQTQRLRTLQDELVTCKIDLDDDHDQDDRIIAKLASENEALWTSVRSLQREVSSLSEESSQKVISLKEEMNRLLRENDELRAAVAGLQDNPQRFKTVMSAQSMSSLMLSPEPCEIVSDVPSSRSASGLDAASCSNQDFSTFKDLQFHSPDLPLVKDENSELFIEEGIGPDTHWIYALLQREEQNPEKESLHSLSNFPSWENTTSDILVVNGEKPAANIPQSQSNGHDDEKLFQSSSADRLHYKNLPQVKGRYTADEESVQEEKPEDEWKHPKGVEEEFNHQIEILEKLLVLELNQVEKWHSLVSQCQHRSSSMTPGFSFICRYLDHLLTSFTKISSDKHGDSSEEQQFNDDLTRRSEGKSKHNFRLLHSWLDSWGMDPRKFMAASHDFVKEVQHASKDLLKLAEEKVVMTAHSMNRFGRSVWEKNRKPLKDILQEFGKQVQTIGGLRAIQVRHSKSGKNIIRPGGRIDLKAGKSNKYLKRKQNSGVLDGIGKIVGRRLAQALTDPPALALLR
ncbi:unnamed protein product [Darwinula stevensoni]|uniref:Uncharacterized protein n=1 Tax=Darwinula stevensoni TaxID=69355 RepID=A0A7R8X0F4_9CRUS|nr:unnamed protein product [Darwinula stevensoni]CAG0881089.1 unnamed protein product [Darwinula stevensoni]